MYTITDAESGNRKYHLDLLRIIAIFMVLFNHTGTNGFLLFTIARESKLYIFYLFLTIFIKIAVPLFFMISGALLLPRGYWAEPGNTRRKFIKFLEVLFICSLIWHLYSLGFNLNKFNLETFLTDLYSSNINFVYWYLYSYLAYILLLPILGTIAKTLSARNFVYIIIVYFSMQMLSILQYIIWKGQVTYNGSFSLFIMGNNIFYPLLGYFIEERIPKKYYTKKILAVMFFASVVSVLACCFLTHYRCNLINEWSGESCEFFFNTLIFIPSATVYFAAKMWCDNHKLRKTTAKILAISGSCTFGIYLFEGVYRRLTLFIFDAMLPYLHTLPSCIIWIFSSCILGMAVTLVLKKIPVINKYI